MKETRGGMTFPDVGPLNVRIKLEQMSISRFAFLGALATQTQ